MGPEHSSNRADRPHSLQTALVPAGVADVTGLWLRRSLGLAGQGGPTDVAVERVGQGFGLSSVLLRARLAQGEAAPVSVVVKLWSIEHAPPHREAQVLRALADRPGLRVPACHHAAVDEAAGRAVLVLEDVGEVEQGDATGELSAEQATRIARALAALHATCWGDAAGTWAGRVPRSPWLGLEPGWFPPRVEMALERFRDRLGETATGLLADMHGVYERAVSRLDGSPTTLLHDDLHLDNVVFDRSTGEPILLDWARAAIGPAVLDLAELLVMVAAPGSTDALLAAYRGELLEHGVPASDVGSVEAAVAAAVVITFVRGTCGVARWEAGSAREARLLERIVDRARRGAEEWRHRDPGLLQWGGGS